LDRLNPDGDEGRFEAFAFDNVLCIGIGKIGLPSKVGPGEIALWGPVPGLITAGLLCAAIASARSFCMTSLLAFSNTGKFLKAKLPKSSATTGSLSRRLFMSRT
jgi:hypothetical protein